MELKGWGKPGVSRKYHYFDNTPESKDRGTSLCRKFGFYFPGEGGLEDAHDEHPDNCTDCKRRKAKLDAKAKQSPENNPPPIQIDIDRWQHTG